MPRRFIFFMLAVFFVADPLISAELAQAPPYPPSPVIDRIELDWSTHRRDAQGSDNFQLTWADDDHQYGAWGDGGGFGDARGADRVGLGFARVEGGWQAYRGINVWGGRNSQHPAQFDGKSWGTICIGGVLYSWIVPDVPESGPPRDHYRYVELARSTDHAATWTKADWRWRVEDDLIIPTFLVFGKDNAGARDDYVYSYFIRPERKDVTQAGHGLEIHKPGAVYLARVRSDRIFDGRESYEWFTGVRDAEATWGSLAAKRPVFEDPNGVGWCMSVCHDAGLDRYLLSTEHTASHSGILGHFDAPEPWGPWTTVAYHSATNRFGEQRPGSTLPWKHNVFFAAFAPKWFQAGDGFFTLVFTGGGRGADNDSFNTVRGRFIVRP